MNQEIESRYLSRCQSQLRAFLLLDGKGKTQGFTLIEVLLVIVIAGILAAIAAPGWLAFMNRQRLNTAQTELLQMLRQAQKNSITKRTTYGIEIQADGKTIRNFTAKDAGINGIAPTRYTGEEFVLGSGEAENLSVRTLDNRDQIAFNFDGSVVGSVTNLIVVSNDQPDAPQCIVIETILGAMREGSGDECLN